MTHVQPTRVHIKDLPQVVLGTNNLSFKIGHRVKSVPRLSLEDDNIIYDSIDRPTLRISNSRAVFFHSFTIGINLYESTGLEDDIVVFNPMNPLESSQWSKDVFYATAEHGFALYKAKDQQATKLAHLRPAMSRKKLDDAEGEVWLDVHVEFRAGPGQTVIGQRRRINKNTGEIEYGQTFVQSLDVALESYAELGQAIEEVLNPASSLENVIDFNARDD